MYRIIIIAIFIFCDLSCSRKEKINKVDNNTNTLSLESVMLEGFAPPETSALDLLDLFVMYGYESQNYQIKLVVDGDAISQLERRMLVVKDCDTANDFLKLITESTNTSYIFEGNILRIRASPPQKKTKN